MKKNKGKGVDKKGGTKVGKGGRKRAGNRDEKRDWKRVGKRGWKGTRIGVGKGVGKGWEKMEKLGKWVGTIYKQKKRKVEKGERIIKG